MQIRLSVTLSGGASLGAYQAGAMAALLVAIQDRIEAGDDRVRLEAVGGASAGALVALFSAHALARGIDPVALLRTTWVERVSLDLLRSRHGRAPLDFEAMRDGLRGVLGADGGAPRHPPSRTPQPTPVVLHVSLTGLQGLTYPIRSIRREQDITGVTYADWGWFTLEPGDGPERLFEPPDASPLDFVLASAANPGGFAPRLLDRGRDAPAYEARGIRDLPDHGRLWYGDGGLVQTEPLGRVLAAGRLRGDHAGGRGVRRVQVVVDPRSEEPSGSGRWTNPGDVPRWEEGLSRALAILPAQILYDDLRRTEKRNTRLDWADALTDALAPHLDAGAADALDRVLATMAEDRASLRRDEPRPGRQEPDQAGEDPRDKLYRAVAEVAGLAAKERVAVDVISPRLISDERDEEVPALLAGEFLGDFGGFLREELRQSDFCLGYHSGRVWLERALPETELDGATVERLLDAVDQQSPGDWREANRGEAGIRSLPVRARLRLARYAAHMGRVIATALLRR